MIAVDTNLLVYAHRPEVSFHEKAQELIRDLAEGTERWAIPFHCLVEFAGVVTNPRIFRQPTSGLELRRQVDDWLESPSLAVLTEDAESWSVLAQLLVASKAQGAKVHDARIAACCQYHRVTELWTADRDFGRFAPLKTRNPLI